MRNAKRPAGPERIGGPLPFAAINSDNVRMIPEHAPIRRLLRWLRPWLGPGAILLLVFIGGWGAFSLHRQLCQNRWPSPEETWACRETAHAYLEAIRMERAAEATSYQSDKILFPRWNPEAFWMLNRNPIFKQPLHAERAWIWRTRLFDAPRIKWRFVPEPHAFPDEEEVERAIDVELVREVDDRWRIIDFRYVGPPVLKHIP